MDDAKYVIVVGVFGERAIIFDKMISHDAFFNLNVVAAGFIGFSQTTDEKISIRSYGHSSSLNLKSRGTTDDYLICKALNPINDQDCWVFVPAKRK